MAAITVELYGIPRLRAGTGRVDLDSATPREALATLGSLCPDLVGSVLDPERGGVQKFYAISLNGERFISDPDHPLSNGDVLILLSADAGG